MMYFIREIFNEKDGRIILGLFVLCLLNMLVINLFFENSFLESIKIVFGTVMFFFLPGYILLLNTLKECDVFERVGVSIGVSISLIGVGSFILNYIFSVKLNLENIYLMVLTMIIFLFIIKIMLRVKNEK